MQQDLNKVQIQLRSFPKFRQLIEKGHAVPVIIFVQYLHNVKVGYSDNWMPYLQL